MDETLQAIAIYDKIAPIYANNFSCPAEHIDEFLELVSDSGIIIDIGCAHGMNTNYMRSAGFRVVGIDLSSEMIKLANARFPEIDFRLKDMRELEFEPDSIEGVFASYSLIHLLKRDVLSVLRVFNRLLKKNGTLYISVQMGQSAEMYTGMPLKEDEKIFLSVYSFVKNVVDIWSRKHTTFRMLNSC